MQIEIIEYRTTDQNWQDETTVVWFAVECGDEVYTDEYGVLFCGNDEPTLVNSDGEPVSADNNYVYDLILDILVDPAKKELENE